MDEYVKWSVGPFWQQILGSNKQASFIKRAGEPLGKAFTSYVKLDNLVLALNSLIL